MLRIEFACNLKELLPKVVEIPSWRDHKWSIGAMSGPTARNLVRLNLRALGCIPHS